MRTIIGIVLLAIAVAGCGGTTARDKAGTRADALTLMVGDRSGSASEQVARRFASEVANRSDGALRIEVQVTDEVALPADYGTQAIGDAQAGQVDGVAVVARAWRAAGVSSLEPLEVPLLIGSEAALNAVTSDDVAADMLGGVRAAGLEPLALVPQALPVLQSYGAPLVTMDGLRGARIRTWPDGPVADSLQALGAQPTWIGGFAFEQAARAGELDGAVTPLDPTVVVIPGTFTANVPLYADAITLAIAEPVWSGLDDDAQRALRDAAVAVRGAWATARGELGPGAAAACDSSSGVALADATTLGTFSAALAPVEAQIAALGGNAAVIERIRAIAAAHPAEPVTPCRRPQPSTAPTPSGAASALEGVWRRNMTEDEWRQRGFAPYAYPTNGGLHTMTFADGRWHDHDDVAGHPPDAEGTYTVSGNRVTVTFGGGVLFEAAFELDGEDLVLRGAHGGDELSSMWNGTWRPVS